MCVDLTYFDKIYCTNMSYRPDRWQQVLVEFDKLGIKGKVIRFEGIESYGNDAYKNRWMGCNLSHLNILEHSDNERVLIFEDDVIFINDFKNILQSAIEELKEKEWGMFYLGGNICGSITQETEHLGRLSHAQSTQSYAVNKNFNKEILKYKELFYDKQVDLVYAQNIIPNYPCYITIPMVTLQRSDYSDIEQRNVNYDSWMEQRYFDNLVRR